MKNLQVYNFKINVSSIHSNFIKRIVVTAEHNQIQAKLTYF
jgi:hypothetical protein